MMCRDVSVVCWVVACVLEAVLCHFGGGAGHVIVAVHVWLESSTWEIATRERTWVRN
jgi:hypothetical protein